MATTQMYWRNKRVLVTGGFGFFGSHVVALLAKETLRELRVVPRQIADLREYSACIRQCVNIDIVIHLAGNVGGIGYNQKNPATLFDDNLLMGVNMVRAAHKSGVKKFVGIGTVCSYPKFTSVPFSEDHLWDGYPEETNAAYGLAKKALLTQLSAYRAQYNFNGIYLIPENLYGPGDSIDPSSSHVIPALIAKVLYALQHHAKSIHVWGTGRATREFLYVSDAARAVVLAAERYSSSDPVNIGASGGEISIRELVEMIADIAGYKGVILFDAARPDGQPRRALDTSKASLLFGFRAKTTLRYGLEQTIRWHQTKRRNEN